MVDIKVKTGMLGEEERWGTFRSRQLLRWVRDKGRIRKDELEMQSHGHTQLVTPKLSSKDEELSRSACNLKQPEKTQCEGEVVMQEERTSMTKEARQ